MIGIYSWVNKTNNKRYIGQSVDIERRKQQHISSAGKLNTKISQALGKYGIENFSFEILEECSIDTLNTRERFWIDYYDTISQGYNITQIDDNGCRVYGDFNPNRKLTSNDVLNIRNRIYINKESLKDVYIDYRDIVSYDTFWAAAHGDTWKNVDTDMIYLLKPNNAGSKNPRAALNEELVLNIRNRVFQNGEASLSVYEEYKDIISYSAFQKMLSGQTWKNVDTSMIVPQKTERSGKSKAKLTEKDVYYIRHSVENGLKTVSELCKEYYNVTPVTIRRVVEYKTWKNIKPVSTIPEA